MTLDIKNDPPEPPPSDEWPQEPNVLGHGAFIKAMVALVIILVLGMVSLIFVRAQAVEEPTAAVLLVGDKYLADATIMINANAVPIVTTQLVADYEYTVPILLIPGAYETTVTLPGEEVMRQPLQVPEGRMRKMDLPTSVVVKGDESLSDAEVTLSGGEPYSRAVKRLTLSNDVWSAVLHTFPGQYHLIVTREGQVVRDVNFVLEAHHPKVITLFSHVEHDQSSAEAK